MDLKEQIQKFLRSQLPFLAKLLKLEEPQEDILEEEYFDEEEDTLVEEGGSGIEEEKPSLKDRVLSQLPFLKKVLPEKEREGEAQDVEIGGEETSDDEEKEKRKKRFTLIVRGIAILGILYFAMDEFLLKEEANDKPLGSIKKERRVDTKKKKQELVNKESPVQKENSIGEENSMGENSMGDSHTQGLEDGLSPKDFVPEKDSLAYEEDLEYEEKPSEGGLDSTDFDHKGYEKSPGDDMASSVVFEESYTDITETEFKEEMEKTPVPDETPLIEKEQIEGVSLDIIKDLEEKLRQKENLYDREFLGQGDPSLRGKKAPMVDYFRGGRGLVFNCVEGHWACVDQISYNNCRDANKIDKSSRRPTSCLYYDVYMSDRDCQRIQYEFMEREDLGQAECEN